MINKYILTDNYRYCSDILSLSFRDILLVLLKINQLTKLMKTKNRFLLAITSVLLLINVTIFAQEEKKAQYYTVTTMHFNLDNDSDADWKAVEKEYMDKVTMKNDYVMNAGYYTHLYTANSTDVKYVQVYSSWEDIDKAGQRNSELEKEAWPDETARKAFLKKQGDFYQQVHSDEIYTILPGGKSSSDPVGEDWILYVRTQHMAYPENAPEGELGKLRTEYLENVIYKNDLIKGYYPHRHFWGHDSSEFIEAFFLESMDDLAKMNDKNGELYQAHFKDEDARKDFWNKISKYYTGVHGDEIYSIVSDLRK